MTMKYKNYNLNFADTSGTYLYRESSDRGLGPDAVLLSPEVTYFMDQMYCFVFYYNMFGEGSGKSEYQRQAPCV